MEHQPPSRYVKLSTHFTQLKFKELGENFDIENFTRVVKWYYENFVMNNPMPQKPNYIFGLAKCMR